MAFYSNCTFSLKDDPECPDPIVRAAKLIAAHLACKPAVNMNRQPAADKDILVQAKGNSVVVAYRGQLYVLEPASDVNLELTLRAIVKHARTSQPEPQVGWLTSLPRDAWVKYFNLLGESTRKIQQACLFVALDLDTFPVGDDEFAWAMACGNLNNRWQDRSVQMLVFGNAKVGFLIEHTVFDARPLGRYFSSLTLLPLVELGSKLGHFEKITWPEHDLLESGINEAKAYTREELVKREICCVRTRALGSDVDVQDVIQKAVFEVFGEHKVIAEAISMAHMPHGRYDTVFFDPGESAADRLKRIKAAKACEPFEPKPCEISTSNAGFYENIDLIGFTDTDPNLLGISYSITLLETLFHIKADGRLFGFARKFSDQICVSSL